MTKPKYAIGDRIPNTKYIVRGVMTTAIGRHKYFLQIFDGSIVVFEEDIEDLTA